MKSETKPLPLSDVLRDLAHIRASGLSSSQLYPSQALQSAQNGDSKVEIDSSVAGSYAFVQTARSAIRLDHSGKLDLQGTKLEGIRDRIDGVVEGLQS